MTSHILVSIRVPATPARAFEVFTREIGVWWQPNGLFRFTHRSPGRLKFEPGSDGRLVEILPNGELFEVGNVTSWEPGVRLGFNWRQESFAPEQLTHVMVRFEPVGDETRVTVEHYGWDTIPPEHVARHHFPDAIFLRRHAEWWQALLSSYNSCISSLAIDAAW
jgi:Activator of Hsp90 ATPase homolog 1-like protein